MIKHRIWFSSLCSALGYPRQLVSTSHRFYWWYSYTMTHVRWVLPLSVTCESLKPGYFQCILKCHSLSWRSDSLTTISRFDTFAILESARQFVGESLTWPIIKTQQRASLVNCKCYTLEPILRTQLADGIKTDATHPACLRNWGGCTYVSMYLALNSISYFQSAVIKRINKLALHQGIQGSFWVWA